MSVAIMQGGNVPLAPALQGGTRLAIVLEWSGMAVRVAPAVFLLNAQHRIRHADDLMGGQRQASPDGGVRLLGPGGPGQAAVVAVDLAPLPADVDTIAFTLTCLDRSGPALGSLSHAVIRVTSPDGASELCRYELPVPRSDFRALIAGELYRRGAEWKFRAVGQGFAGGWEPLAKHLGFATAPEFKPVAGAPPSTPLSALPTVAMPPPVFPPRVSPGVGGALSLDQPGQSVSLDDASGGLGDMEVRLEWQTRTAQGTSIDLDLGCLYQLRDGSAGAVQALGGEWGSYDAPPYIHHGGDARKADDVGEVLRINGARWPELKRILIFAFIYEGVPHWRAAQAVATLSVPGRPPLELPLLETQADRVMCAVATLENYFGDLVVTRLGQYFRGHEEMDQAFGFGLDWVAGRKE